MRRGQLRQADVVVAPARDPRARALREARRSGVLSLPARGLREFPHEAYHLEDHMDKASDEKRWECVDLVKVDLSHNEIAAISDEVAALRSVAAFKMRQNALSALPDGFFELTALTHLDLSSNQLEGDLPDRFGLLANLKELSLAGNRLARLPETMGALAQLEVLSIEENALTALPERIGGLGRLHTLTAHSNQLTALPPSFGQLRNMQTLDLKKNRLETTAGALAELRALRYLDLRNNRLMVFPLLPASTALDQVFLGYNLLPSVDEDSVLRIKDSVTVFEIRDNKLAALPAKLPYLYRLKTLDVANNDLSDLPPGLGYLKHLHHLVVDGNPLRTIRWSIVSAGTQALKKYLRSRGPPPVGVDVMEEEMDEFALPQQGYEAPTQSSDGSVGSPHTIKMFREAASSGTLDMTSYGLRSVPVELDTSSNNNSWNFAATLLHLNLSKNGLEALPNEIGGLLALKSLTVEENSLRSLDPSIAALPSLQLLRVRKNQLTAASVDRFLGLSPAIGRSLKELDLRNNILTEMPATIRGLYELETLLLAYNRIETLDGFEWSWLRAVSVVSVSDNKLRSLGRIFEAPSIASLSFDNNNLRAVPCELGLCPNLRAVYMNGNPQKTVRGAVIAKGSQEILAYLKNKVPPGTVLSPPSPAPPAPSPVAQPSLSSAPAGRAASASSVARRAPEQEQQTATPRFARVALVSKPEGTTAAAALDQQQHEDVGGDVEDELSAQIKQRERELESFSLSAAKRFAIKKDLAMLRAKQIRQERARAARR